MGLLRARSPSDKRGCPRDQFPRGSFAVKCRFPGKKRQGTRDTEQGTRDMGQGTREKGKGTREKGKGTREKGKESKRTTDSELRESDLVQQRLEPRIGAQPVEIRLNVQS